MTSSGESFPVAISARYRGLDGPGTAGGDFYARCDTERGVRVIIGDVRGKGASAVGKARLLADAFLRFAAERPELEEVSRALDHLSAVDAAGEWDAAAREWFATAVLLEIDRQGHRATVINHGHPAPVVIDAATEAGAGTVRELVPSRTRLPLGLGDLVAVEGLADTVELGADAMLLLFTDGVCEARDRAGRMFDPVAWLTANANAAANAVAEAGAVAGASVGTGARPVPGTGKGFASDEGPSMLLDSLLVEVERYNGGAWRDDLALVSVRRRALPVDGTPAAVPSRVPQNRTPPVTLPPAMMPSAPNSRRPIAPPRPRAPRNPSRRPGGGPSPDGTTPQPS